MLAQIRPLSFSYIPQMILDFTVVTFQKEKQFYYAEVSYELLDYSTSLTYVFVYFCRICNSYHLCTKRL